MRTGNRGSGGRWLERLGRLSAGAAAGALLLGGCQEPARSPRTEAAQLSGFTYIPLDPLPVSEERGRGCFNDDRGENALGPVLPSLPDNAVRMAVRQLDAKGSATIGPATVGVENSQYQVILDYINADVVNIRLLITRQKAAPAAAAATAAVGDPGTIVRIQRLPQYDYAAAEPKPAASAGASPADPSADLPRAIRAQEEEVVIPVYVGVGLRLTANVNVLKGKVNLSSLGALAAEAQAGNISGSLIVQTLGITGKQVTSSLPLPSELNPTTIQNAVLALGSVKAIVYDQPNTIVIPRVTGIYNPLGKSDERTVNLIVSELAREPLPWRRECLKPVAEAAAAPR